MSWPLFSAFAQDQQPEWYTEECKHKGDHLLIQAVLSLRLHTRSVMMSNVTGTVIDTNADPTALALKHFFPHMTVSSLYCDSFPRMRF